MQKQNYFNGLPSFIEACLNNPTTERQICILKLPEYPYIFKIEGGTDTAISLGGQVMPNRGLKEDNVIFVITKAERSKGEVRHECRLVITPEFGIEGHLHGYLLHSIASFNIYLNRNSNAIR